MELRDAIGRATARDSAYWAFRDEDEAAAGSIHDVEIRINLPEQALVGIGPFDGWLTARVDKSLGALFLRRRQDLSDEAVIRLLTDAITIAFERNGQFHSWVAVDTPEVTRR